MIQGPGCDRGSGYLGGTEVRSQELRRPKNHQTALTTLLVPASPTPPPLSPPGRSLGGQDHCNTASYSADEIELETMVWLEDQNIRHQQIRLKTERLYETFTAVTRQVLRKITHRQELFFPNSRSPGNS